jgi:hypothetical protein
MQDAMNGQLHGLQQKFNTQAVILFNGGNRSNKSGILDGFLPIQVALVGGSFSCLNFLDDRVNCRFLKGLDPKGSVHGFFNFVIAFTGPSEAGDKVASSSHAAVGKGWRKLACSGRVCWSALAPYNGVPLTTSVQLVAKNILCFITKPLT